jgi:exodeoxyribonuclease VII large subunit
VRRRQPGLEIILAPCRVQGEGAAQEIAAAIRLLNEYSQLARPLNPLTVNSECAPTLQRSNAPTNLDLILVTRGGGSLEDLWAFNEEAVARAIFESAIPVVSAVGHEIDFTISDFVADVRAATPSAAAEIITAGVFGSGEFISNAAARIRQLARQQLEDKTEDLARLNRRQALAHPRRRFDAWLQRLDDVQTTLLRNVKQETRRQRIAWGQLSERLARLRPAQLLKQRRELLEQAARRLREQTRRCLRERQQGCDGLQARLRLLGPEQVLARGYSITTDAATDKIVRTAAEVKGGQQLRTRLKSGEVFSLAEERV